MAGRMPYNFDRVALLFEKNVNQKFKQCVFLEMIEEVEGDVEYIEDMGDDAQESKDNGGEKDNSTSELFKTWNVDCLLVTAAAVLLWNAVGLFGWWTEKSLVNRLSQLVNDVRSLIGRSRLLNLSLSAIILSKVLLLLRVIMSHESFDFVTLEGSRSKSKGNVSSS